MCEERNTTHLSYCALQTDIPVLGVVENMAGLRQRADAFRFTLPGAGTAAGSGKQQSGSSGSGSGSTAAEERDVTERVLAALRQVDPSLEVSVVTPLLVVICLVGDRCLQYVGFQAGVVCTALSVVFDHDSI